jgi:hypothetical protein
MTKSALSSQPGVPARLVLFHQISIENLKTYGPMKLKIFVKYYSQDLLDHMIVCRDVKLKESHIGTVVVLNLYKFPKHYDYFHTINTLTSSIILRAALERYCSTNDTKLISRSSTSAWIIRDNVRILVLARLFHQKVRSLKLLLDRLEKPKPAQVIVVVPKKHKNFFGKIDGYQISILELGPSFTPIYNKRRR